MIDLMRSRHTSNVGLVSTAALSMLFLACVLHKYPGSSQQPASHGVVTLKNGPNLVDLLGDGTRSEVFVSWRGNFNAHGFHTATFYVLARSDVPDAGDVWQVVPFMDGPRDTDREQDLYGTFQGADCALADLRLLHREHATALVILATRDFGESFSDSAAVRFDYYELTRNPDGMFGRPPFYFHYIRTVHARQSYCDVNLAFAHELGLGAHGLAHGEDEP